MMVETGAQENSGVREFRPKLIILMIAYLGIWVSTLAHFMGDTNVYAQAILRHAYGFSDDYHLTTSNPFVDFGHLLWRPLGWLFFVIARPATRLLTHQNQRAEVILTLIGITFLASAVGVVVFFLLARRLVGDDWSALWASVGFFSADAFLNYAHTGNAYILGATCLVVGIYLTVPREAADGVPGQSVTCRYFLCSDRLFLVSLCVCATRGDGHATITRRTHRGALTVSRTDHRRVRDSRAGRLLGRGCQTEVSGISPTWKHGFWPLVMAKYRREAYAQRPAWRSRSRDRLSTWAEMECG